MFTFFHVSDFHFKADFPSVERLKCLVKDIEAKLPRHDAFLIFSGDLAFSGDQAQYESLLEHFFIPLEGKFKKIYLVPGNHDIQRDRTDQHQVGSLLADKGQSYLYKGQSTISLESPFGDCDPLQNYADFAGLLSSSLESNFFFWRDVTEGLEVVGFNSTWLSCKRTDGTSDLGNLRVDPAVIEAAVNKMSSDKLKIAVMHHPLEWIDEELRRSVQDRLIQNFDLVLTGHVHTPAKVHGSFDAGECIFLQAPAAKSNYSFGNNAYSIVNVATGSNACEIIYRTYSEPRKEFVAGDEICENGITYPNDDHKEVWRKQKTQTPEGLIEEFRNRRNGFDGQDWYARNFVSKTQGVTDFFEPRVSRLRFKDGEQFIDRPTKITDALSLSSKRQVVLGPKDSGLTTAAFVYVRKLVEAPEDCEQIPVYIQLSGMAANRINRASLLREASKGCVLQFTHTQIEKLAEAGVLQFVFDQVSISDTAKLAALDDVLDKYFKDCPSLFFASSDFASGSSSDELPLHLSPNDENLFQLEEMTSRCIREFINVTRPSIAEDEKASLLNNVVASFKQMDEPVFPSSVSILLETLDQIPGFRPLNRVKLLERYVECLLGRYELQDVQEGEFNSTEKIKLLAFVAGHMAKNKLIRLTEDEWSSLVAEYAENKLLELPNGLIDDFVEKAMLIRGASGITFRADYLYTFFVAREMNVNPELFKFITSDDTFFIFHRELVFFGELDGVDTTALLTATKLRIEDLEEKILEQYSVHGIDLESEFQSMLSEVHGNGTLEDLSDVVDSVLDSVPDELTEDVSRNQDLVNVDRRRGVQTRKNIRFIEARWYIAMRTYFQLIRHSTGLSGEVKKSHISKALDSASLFLNTIAAKRGTLATKPAVLASGILYYNPVAMVDPQKAIERFKYDAPQSIGRNLLEYLVNPLLAPAFRSELGSDDGTKEYFLRYLMLQLPSARNAEAYLKSVASSSEQEMALQTASLEDLKDKFMGYKISDEARSYYSGIIEAIANSPELKGRVSQRKLQRDRNLLDIKKNLSGDN